MSNDFIAYFSMEIALEPGMPTYSGGLGVLAGDTIRSAADLKLPMVAVTLVYSARDEEHNQTVVLREFLLETKPSSRGGRGE